MSPGRRLFVSLYGALEEQAAEEDACGEEHPALGWTAREPATEAAAFFAALTIAGLIGAVGHSSGPFV